MDDLNRYAAEFSRRLDRQVEAARRQHELAVATLVGSEPVRSRTVDGRLREYDALIGRRWATVAEAGQAAPRPAVASRMELTTHPELERVDHTFARLFVARGPGWPAGPRYPTYLCETLPEFLQPQLETAELSPTQKATLLSDWQAQAETTARQSQGRAGVFGVNLPGQGCYLNGWLFNYGRPGRPRDCLDDPSLRARILETAAHEKWGHGFITDHTALGAEKKALGLQFLELAGRFGHRPVDTPTWALLIERYNTVHQVSEFLEEGWATWIEGALMSGLLGQPERPRYALREVWNAVAGGEGAAEARESALSALRVIFLDEHPDWETLHAAIIVLQGLLAAGRPIRAVLDESLSRAFGQPSPYIVGALLVDRIAAAWGPRCAPAAVRMAGNLTYGLSQLGTADLTRLVWQPRFNPDSRLAAISRLPPGPPDDVRALAVAAREHLNLAVPAGLEL